MKDIPEAARRRFLAGAGSTPLLSLLGSESAQAATAPSRAGNVAAAITSLKVPADLATLYDVDRTITNFDAGYYGAMTKPVHAAYVERLAWANRFNSTFLRGAMADADPDVELDKARAAVARLIGAAPDEIALTSGGTEGLYSLIVNYRPIQPGDAVIYCDVDYDEMQYAMAYLEKSRGASVVRFSMPEPHTRANVLAAYEKVLSETPRAKLLLLTHVSNRNGLVPPVAEIAAMAKARGVDVILDSAHAVGALPFKVADTGVDFIGFSLHKWVAAPLGTGAIWIRRQRQPDILPWLGNGVYGADDILSRSSTGTVDFAARLTIPTAIAVHDQIGGTRKHDRLKLLRDHWVDRVREIPGIQIMLPAEKDNYVAISSFRLPGMRSIDQARQAHKVFLRKHRMLVVAKGGLDSGAVLRVTPALFNSHEELDRLVAGIRAERDLFT
jgi:selenocysteine lyase/cysteine desulfurase